MQSVASEPRRFTTIKNLSERRQLPRLGKIHLGVKKISEKSGKEYPVEVDYFVCPPEVRMIYGEEPKELDIMFPTNDAQDFFPQAYCCYGKNQRLKCKGDGESACQWAKGNVMKEVDCPCDKLDNGECSQRGNLMVFLPLVSLGGVYQLDTGSYHNIVRTNSYIGFLQTLIGRCALVPLKIRRVKEKIQNPDETMSTHYLFQFEFQGGVDVINQLRGDSQKIIANVKQFALPEPKEPKEIVSTPPGVVHAESRKSPERPQPENHKKKPTAEVTPAPGKTETQPEPRPDSAPPTDSGSSPAAPDPTPEDIEDIDTWAPPRCPKCTKDMIKDQDDKGLDYWRCSDPGCTGVWRDETDAPEQDTPPPAQHVRAWEDESKPLPQRVWAACMELALGDKEMAGQILLEITACKSPGGKPVKGVSSPNDPRFASEKWQKMALAKAVAQLAKERAKK